MKLVKYIVFICLFSVVFANAQQFRFQTSNVSVLEKNAKGKWGKWSKPAKTTVFVTLDLDKNKIIIYSAAIQHYKIVEYLGKSLSKVDEINSYLCKSNEGINVKISFMVRKDLKNKTQLYVYNEDFTYCYDITEVTK